MVDIKERDINRPVFLRRKDRFALKVWLRLKIQISLEVLIFLDLPRKTLPTPKKWLMPQSPYIFWMVFILLQFTMHRAPRTFFCRGHFRLATSGRRPPAVAHKRHLAAATAMNEATRCKCNLESQAALVSRFARSLYYYIVQGVPRLYCFCAPRKPYYWDNRTIRGRI